MPSNRMTSALSTEVGSDLRELVTKSYCGMEAGSPSFRSCSVATISLHANACTHESLVTSMGDVAVHFCDVNFYCGMHVRALRPSDSAA